MNDSLDSQNLEPLIFLNFFAPKKYSNIVNIKIIRFIHCALNEFISYLI